MNHPDQCVVVPGEGPLSIVAIKRALLTFEMVTLPSPQDVGYGIEPAKPPPPNARNFGEIHGLEGRFPNNDEWRASLIELLPHLSPFRQDLTVGVLPATHPLGLYAYPSTETTFRLIKQPEVLRAAAPDFDSQGARPPEVVRPWKLNVGGGFLNGGGFAGVIINGGVKFDGPFSDDAWNQAALGRVARVVKYYRIAEFLNAAPLETTTLGAEVSASVFAAMPVVPTGGFLGSAVAMKLFDDSFDDYLKSASWREIADLRREVLPAVLKVKSELTTRAQRAAATFETTKDAEAAVAQLQHEFVELQSELSTSGANLRLQLLAGLGDRVAKSAATLVGADLFMNVALASVEGMCLATVFGLGSVLSAIDRERKDVAAYFSLRAAVERHPLQFTVSLPGPKRSLLST